MSTVGTFGTSATQRRMSGLSSKARLHDLQIEVEMGAVLRRLEAARIRRHRHDTVNVLAGVEGAFTLLVQETLSVHDRATLTEMLATGLSQLRTIVSSGPDNCRSVLGDLATSLAAEPNYRGRICVDVATDMVVAGSPDEIMEAVRRLVTHAIDRSPTGRVGLRARRTSDGDRVEVWVDDDGVQPGADDGFHTGGWIRRPWSVSELSTELEVAIRLAEGQRGEVRIEPRPGGGVSLRFSWPVPVD
jgi:signal transduction histidine kinase